MSHTTETLGLMKSALSQAIQMDEPLNKAVTQASNITFFDLQAPSKNLYPVLTPLRNIIPRVSGGGGTATNWKEIRAINGSGFGSMGWVPEGQRSGRMSYSANDKSASYVTIGEEDSITFEARNAAVNFEDIQTTASMRVLQQMMIKEEHALLGGNKTLNLGTPATPTTSASGAGGTLPNATYGVICVALTYEGMQTASLAGGIPTSQLVTGADGETFTLNGGSSNKSATASQAVGAGNTLFASVTPVVGAAGYAWFVGAVASERLERITTINSVAISTPLAGTGQTAASVTASDKSSNPNYAFDGLLTRALTAGSGAYVQTLATGTAGTGTVLTSSARGTITQIDDMCRSMWDAYRLSVDQIYVNAQELQNITNKCLNASSSPLLQIMVDPKTGLGQMTAGGVVGFYFNPFTAEGGAKIPIRLHPNVPAGTILGWCSKLPSHYQSNHVPNVAEVKYRQDYYQMNWPLKSRRLEFGVYADETLAIYCPFAMGVVNNIANG